MKKIAHRGFSENYPENTLLAFQKALDGGVDAIETDLRLSLDNQPIIFHDDDLQRITGLNKTPESLTLNELQALDAGSWFDRRYKDEKIPSLDELLHLCSAKATLILEIKYNPSTYQRLCEEIEKRIHDKPDWVEVSCFDDHVLEYMHQLNPNIKLHKVIKEASTLQNKDFETRYGYTDYFDIDINLRNIVLEKGLIQKHKVIFWTADNEDISAEIKAGLYGVMRKKGDKGERLLKFPRSHRLRLSTGLYDNN
ncbi:MAG: glycerophosphodiester phosphodiesterase family protein [Sulfurimonadaceae bacterium]